MAIFYFTKLNFFSTVSLPTLIISAKLTRLIIIHNLNSMSKPRSYKNKSVTNTCTNNIVCDIKLMVKKILMRKLKKKIFCS